jgi:predicted metal-dependent HD superfamily phosphohydrolase
MNGIAMDSNLSPERFELLQKSWVGLFDRIGVELVVAYRHFDDLVQRYREPHRYYHNLEHIAEMLKVGGKLIDLASQPDAIFLAIWFHDAIYDPKAKDNEERSAGLASATLSAAGVRADLIEKTVDLIRSTAHGDSSGNDSDTQILLDADLAILAAERQRYERYAGDIRKEYMWVDDAAFCAGRVKVLEAFLNRPRIYRTRRMFEVGESMARLNLAAEIEQLTTPPRNDPAD